MKETQPLISVIVPCYNVEKYLDQCVQSIVDQTYTNLEIILVDDGSPDRVPEMCDEWAKKDSRIVVVHKSNGGLSDARNAGLDICTGEYIAFVDSDDFIDNIMYEKLYELHLKTKADVVACLARLYYEKDDKYDMNHRTFLFKESYNSDTYLRELVRRRVGCASWDKLYTKEFVGNSRFIKGRNNEDLIWLYGRFYTGNYNVAYTLDYYYNYRKSEGSITTSKANPHTFDAYYNVLEMTEFDRSHENKLKKELHILKVKTSFSIYWQIKYSKAIGLYHEDYSKVRNIVIKNILMILFSSSYTAKDKIKALLAFYN